MQITVNNIREIIANFFRNRYSIVTDTFKFIVLDRNILDYYVQHVIVRTKATVNADCGRCPRFLISVYRDTCVEGALGYRFLH